MDDEALICSPSNHSLDTLGFICVHATPAAITFKFCGLNFCPCSLVYVLSAAIITLTGCAVLREVLERIPWKVLRFIDVAAMLI